MSHFSLTAVSVHVVLLFQVGVPLVLGLGISWGLARGVWRPGLPGRLRAAGGTGWRVARSALRAVLCAAFVVGWLTLMRIISFPLTVRYFYTVDAGQVAAVHVAVTRHDPAGWSRGGPEFAPVGDVTLTDPAEVGTLIGLLGRSAPYMWDHEDRLGRQYKVSFRRADGTWLAETVTVLPGTTKNAGRYAIWFGRGSSLIGGGTTESYTNPELGKWLEAAVASRLPPDP